MVTIMLYIFFSGHFLGLYGNNDVIYIFQDTSLVYMVTIMVYIYFRHFLGIYGNNNVIYVFQDTSLVYMVTMMV
jgi:ABC-type arginine/histidine transport system permease subunit